METQRYRGGFMSIHGMTRLPCALALACFFGHCDAFNGAHLFSPFTTAWPSSSSLHVPVPLEPTGGGFSTGATPSSRSRQHFRPSAACPRPHHHRQRARRRPLALGVRSSSGRNNGDTTQRGELQQSVLPPEEIHQQQEDVAAVAKTGKKKGDERQNKEGGGGGQEEKGVLGKAGDAAKATFNAFMAAGTIASVVLAAETLWELHGTPLTLTNAVPTLAKLLPLTGIGVFGAAQLVGLVARVVRLIVTLPIMLSGSWVILKNAPQLLPKGDLAGAGSLAAILATPEVLEAAAVLALLGGVVLWATNFATGAVGAVMGRRNSDDDDDDLA